jgi:hypothetical protein
MKISLKSLGNLIAMIIFGLIAYFTAQGNLQETIYFAGIANEIALFLISSAATLISGYCLISK